MNKLDFILDEFKQVEKKNNIEDTTKLLICPNSLGCTYKTRVSFSCIHSEPHKEHKNNWCNILGGACGKLGVCIPYKTAEVIKSCWTCKYGEGVVCTFPEYTRTGEANCKGVYKNWQPKGG